MNTANVKLKASIEQSDYYKCISETANKELEALRTEVDKMRNEIDVQKNAINEFQSAACIDCRVKDKEIKNLKEKLLNTTVICAKNDCELCLEKEQNIDLLEDKITEITILITEQENRLQKIRTQSRKT